MHTHELVCRLVYVCRIREIDKQAHSFYKSDIEKASE